LEKKYHLLCVKRKTHHFWGLIGWLKREGADCVSLNSHFPHQKPQHQILRRKKAEPKTPHFFTLNQDIVAWSQEEKCGVCNAHSAVSKGSS
jgi:hypothetical protein